MSKHLQTDLENIHREILSLAGIVEKMIGDAVRALCERRYELVSEIIDTDDTVDEAEVRVESECLKILALHQPVAGDLRRVATLIKINADLERIADLACNVAERADSMREFPYFPTPELLPEMASNAMEMVRASLDSFVNMDCKTAQKVIHMDNRVDELNVEAIDNLQQLMRENPSFIEPAMHCFSAVRHIERIADHAENIAEDVIYLIEGDIIRHKHGEFT